MNGIATLPVRIDHAHSVARLDRASTTSMFASVRSRRSAASDVCHWIALAQEVPALTPCEIDGAGDWTRTRGDGGRGRSHDTGPGRRTGVRAFIRYHTFGDSRITFTVILRAKEFVDQYLIKHEFVKRLHARFNQEQIVIPFPIRTMAYRESPADDAPPRVAGAA
jgi:hypothetical protein